MRDTNALVVYEHAIVSMRAHSEVIYDVVIRAHRVRRPRRVRSTLYVCAHTWFNTIDRNPFMRGLDIAHRMRKATIRCA